MTAKEYLSQARNLKNRISCKLQRLEELNDLATRCTAVMSGMPHSHGNSTSTMADTIDKIIDLQNEISGDMNGMLNMQKEIADVIQQVENKDQQAVLEKRYLCYQTWECIATDMSFDESWVYRLHSKALNSVQNLLDSKTSE